jgi:PleD family two-component response regulator
MTRRERREFRHTHAREATALPSVDPQRRRRTRVLIAPRVEAVHELARHTLLVVAPNSPRRERIVEQLTAHGYYVLTARTWLGALARASVSHRDVDLVISDPLLPGLGGLPLTQHLRRIQPALPVILTRLCDPPSRNGDPAGPAFLQQEDRRTQPLLEEVEALLFQ